MRIRSIRPEFFQDKVTGALNAELQIFLIGLWCHAEAAGHFENDTVAICRLIFFRKPSYPLKRIESMLGDLARLKIIEPKHCDYMRYTDDDTVQHGILWRVKGWGALQKPHIKESVKLKIIKDHGFAAPCDRCSSSANPLVSGLWSLAPGLREPVSGSWSPVARDARGDSPPVASGEAPSGRSSTSGSEEARTPPHCAHPPEGCVAGCPGDPEPVCPPVGGPAEELSAYGVAYEAWVRRRWAREAKARGE